MSFTRVGLAALAILTFFMAWRWLALRLGARESPGSISALALESLLLTLLAGLWFGSLGSGGVTVLFAVVGALIEVPIRARDRGVAGLPWWSVAGGMARIVIAGWILKLVIG
jgi:hypothetical protein